MNSSSDLFYIAPIQEIATKSTTAGVRFCFSANHQINTILCSGSVGVGETKHFKFQVDSAMVNSSIAAEVSLVIGITGKYFV